MVKLEVPAYEEAAANAGSADGEKTVRLKQRGQANRACAAASRARVQTYQDELVARLNRTESERNRLRRVADKVLRKRSSVESDRERLVRALRRAAPLLASTALSAVDARKLTRALLYALWMADGPASSTAVAVRLADAAVAGGWGTVGLVLDEVARAWAGLDRLRLDKVYAAVSAVAAAGVAAVVAAAAADRDGADGAGGAGAAATRSRQAMGTAVPRRHRRACGRAHRHGFPAVVFSRVGRCAPRGHRRRARSPRRPHGVRRCPI